MIDGFEDLTDEELRVKVKLDIKEAEEIRDERMKVPVDSELTKDFFSEMNDSIDVIRFRLASNPGPSRAELLMFIRVIENERRTVSNRYLKLAQQLMAGDTSSPGGAIAQYIERRNKETKNLSPAETALWDIDDAVPEIESQIAEGLLNVADIRDELHSATTAAEKLRAAIEGGDEVQIDLEHKVLLNEQWHLNEALRKAYAKNKNRKLH